ncbi:MAG TPA: AI-2E family transporter, partial [Candidatus Blautia excrementigallinarum]|nr:AI-2E family transporter [Candidatus Blautia excrementigallinarum]
MDKKQMKSIMLLILFTVMLYVGLQNIDVVLGVLGTMIGLVFPFILGGGIAFVLNVPMSFLERNIFGRGRLKDSRRAAKAARPVSLILALLLVILIIMIAGFVILPELGNTVMGLGKGIETGIRNLQIWIDSTFQNNSAIVEWANSLEIEPQKMVDSIMGVLQNGVNNILSSAVTVTVGIANTAMNASIAFVFACYILIQKEKLMVQAKKALFALLPAKTVNYLLHVCSLANNTFSRFVTGQCIEAVILGTMFFVAMTIFRFPYAMLVGVLIAFTALIPIFGAFIGCAISFLLILLVSPVKALLFLILFLVLQQIEGNLIYPHVVGGSVGLP